MRRLMRAALLVIVWHGAAAAQEGVRWQGTTMVQGIRNERVLGPTFGGQIVDMADGEVRVDLQGECVGTWCDGTRAVLKPRVHGRHVKPRLEGATEPRQTWVKEGYVMKNIGEAASMTIGKRYLGWGAGLLYSPSNRLFPDNGSSSPRRESSGKPLAMMSASPRPQLTVSALAADAYVADLPGVDRSGPFRLLHVEWQGRDDRPFNGGVVWGGGGGYRPYIGGYAQKLLDDTWTVGAEVSTSRGFARQRDDGTGLRADETHRRYDALLNLRYGLTSGGELGIEFVHNGFYLSDSEYRNVALSTQPAGGEWQSRNFVRHPLPEGRYLALQGQWPKLWGDKRWSAFTRYSRGLDYSSGLVFAELGYSPRDDVTLFLGLTRTHGAPPSVPAAALNREVYVAIEIYL